MRLEDFGWERYRAKSGAERDPGTVARVAIEHSTHYTLFTASGELEGILKGGGKRTASRPRVGDWVIFERLQGERKAVIRDILPRISKISRKEAGDGDAEQVIAANVDLAFLVQGLDHNFNLNRLERMLVLAKKGGVRPIILLNKSDLGSEGRTEEVQARIPEVPVLAASAKTGEGMDGIRRMIGHGETIVFLGSSGVGKSTIVNNLLEADLQAVREVRKKDSHGRHTTTRREMFLLPEGGILIDTPGMREFQLWADRRSVKETFEDLAELAGDCMFSDCDHDRSKGCAVVAALEHGSLSPERYESFLKLMREASGAETKLNRAARNLARKRDEKRISKFLKRFYKK